MKRVVLTNALGGGFGLGTLLELSFDLEHNLLNHALANETQHVKSARSDSMFLAIALEKSSDRPLAYQKGWAPFFAYLLEVALLKSRSNHPI